MPDRRDAGGPAHVLRAMIGRRALRFLTAIAASGVVSVTPSPAAGAEASAPTASFSFAPAGPVTGTAVSFADTSTAASGRSIVSRQWDLDGDGAFDDASGASAARSFVWPGFHTVSERVVDSAGAMATASRVVAVGNRPPVAGFVVFPASPAAGDPVYLVSTSFDPDGPLVRRQWDLSGSGTIDDATETSTRAFFEDPGRQTISLTVTDSGGATARASRTIAVGRPRPVLMLPFPIVRIVGALRGADTQIRALTISAPAGARVEVRCRGRGCPRRRVVRKRRAGATAMRAFQRRFAPNTVLEIRVTGSGRIGKYVRFRIRGGGAPARTDACLLPSSGRPTRCPS